MQQLALFYFTLHYEIVNHRHILTSSLTNENDETFNFGVKDGVRGFFTDPSRADGSFVPFKIGGIELELDYTDIYNEGSKTYTMSSSKCIVISSTANGYDFSLGIPTITSSNSDANITTIADDSMNISTSQREILGRQAIRMVEGNIGDILTFSAPGAYQGYIIHVLSM